MKYTKLMEIIRETINEELAFESQASDDAKKQGLEYLGFGRYGKDGKMTHRAVDGKLQPVKGGDAKTPTKSTKPSRAGNYDTPSSPDYLGDKPTSSPETPIQWDERPPGGWPKQGVEPAANAPKPDMSPSADTHAKIVFKVKDKLSAWYDSPDADDMEHVPTAEFSKMTGIPEKALRMYGQTNPDPMEDGVYYDAERDTFTIGGYPDGYGSGDTPFDDEL